MRYLALFAVATLSLLPPREVNAQQPDSGRIVGDLCAIPEGWAPPYTHVYHLRRGATLVFVAVTHGAAINSSTGKQIKAAFDRYKPNLVLVEGASSQKSAQEAYLNFLSERADQQYATGHIQENLYAVKLAADSKVRYMGWDFSPHDEYVADIANGFDISDALGAHLLRSHLDPLGPVSASLVQAEVDAVPHVRQPASFDYSAWYRKAYGDVFEPAEGTPCGHGIASRIVRFESVRRTLNIVTLLDTYAKPGDVVMIEGGAAHWLALRDYLASVSTSSS